MLLLRGWRRPWPRPHKSVCLSCPAPHQGASTERLASAMASAALARENIFTRSSILHSLATSIYAARFTAHRPFSSHAKQATHSTQAGFTVNYRGAQLIVPLCLSNEARPPTAESLRASAHCLRACRTRRRGSEQLLATIHVATATVRRHRCHVLAKGHAFAYRGRVAAPRVTLALRFYLLLSSSVPFAFLLACFGPTNLTRTNHR